MKARLSPHLGFDRCFVQGSPNCEAVIENYELPIHQAAAYSEPFPLLWQNVQPVQLDLLAAWL
ncbi:MAG: hypothetical protein L3J79_06650, partial [Candidatus Marinimicrobia bacterium]|nr:hypothetical protein [Candidatus Neomarinimicrobiota bacterium]